jgi:hypothetical protein
VFQAPLVLRLFALTPLANIQHSLIYALSFRFNALWLVTLYYINTCLFRYLLRDYHSLFARFLFTTPLYEHSYGVKHARGASGVAR